MVAFERPDHLLLAKVEAVSEINAGVEANVTSNLVGIEPFDKETPLSEKIRELIEG